MKLNFSPRWIVALSVLIAVPAAADVLIVGSGQAYTTIQSAVDAADPYDTIIVLPGNYDEDVNIRPNKDGLTIISTEVSSLGENTTVKAFSLLFAPTNGADFVTIAGFKIGPGGDDNGVCIESSGDYATFAHNHILNCNYDGIRINGGGNFDNNVHHNLIECWSGSCNANRNAIQLEDSASGDHNLHHNFIDGYWRNGINVGADNTLVHQNDIANATNRAIRVGGDYNFLHHNIACGSVQIASSAAETKFQHNDYMDPLLDQSTSTAMKKNEEITDCPFD